MARDKGLGDLRREKHGKKDNIIHGSERRRQLTISVANKTTLSDNSEDDCSRTKNEESDTEKDERKKEKRQGRSFG